MSDDELGRVTITHYSSLISSSSLFVCSLRCMGVEEVVDAEPGNLRLVFFHPGQYILEILTFPPASFAADRCDVIFETDSFVR